jgi:predicted nucleic-acid-binding protein
VIALDTNVLVRYLARDDAAQTAQALRLIESRSASSPAFISLVVLVELVWVLERSYRIPKPTVARYLHLLMTGDGVVIEHQELAHEALSAFENQGADFADAVIATLARSASCTTTYTFDRKAARLPGFTLL